MPLLSNSSILSIQKKNVFFFGFYKLRNRDLCFDRRYFCTIAYKFWYSVHSKEKLSVNQIVFKLLRIKIQIVILSTYCVTFHGQLNGRNRSYSKITPSK